MNGSNQPDLVLFLHDEESISVDIELGRVQDGLQRDQTDDLGANHGQLQVLDAHGHTLRGQFSLKRFIFVQLYPSTVTRPRRPCRSPRAPRAAASLRSLGCWWTPEQCWPPQGTSQSPAPSSAARAGSKHRITSVKAAEAANKDEATPSMHLVFATTLLPDVQSKPMSLLSGADQVHVVGNEEFASTSYCGAPRWYKGGGTEVRGPVILFQLKDRHRNTESAHPKLDALEERLHSDWLPASHLLWQSFIFSGSH